MSTQEIVNILELVATGQISIEDAASRVNLLETEPSHYHCGTCRFYRVNQCQSPNHPPRPEHPLSTRCGRYERQPDVRDLAPIHQPSKANGILFK